MSERWLEFAKPFSNRCLVVDTNLLLLLLAGNPTRAGKFKRIAEFSADDFRTLTALVDYFRERSGLATTPHVLTEASNLLGRRPDLRSHLRGFVQEFSEERKPSKELAASPSFPEYGLTDSALIDLSMGSHCVLTVDRPLAGRIYLMGGAAINFNNIRFPID